MIGDLFCITAIVCFIVDVSGIVDQVKHGIFRALYGSKVEFREFTLKPFDCSLCMTFWCGLVYLVVAGRFTLAGIAAVCACSLLSGNMTNVLYLAKDAIGCITNKIMDWIEGKTDSSLRSE